jgi:hypothetical protein
MKKINKHTFGFDKDKKQQQCGKGVSLVNAKSRDMRLCGLRLAHDGLGSWRLVLGWISSTEKFDLN